MSQLVYEIPLHFVHSRDGISIAEHQDLKVTTVENQREAAEHTARLVRELQLPVYEEEFREWARPADLSAPYSDRWCRFVLCDSGETRLVGHLQFRPERMAVPCPQIPLTLLHWPYVVGMASGFKVVYPDFRRTFADCGLVIPDETEGICMLAEARLFNSRLADKAWAGLQWGTLSHTCAVTALADTPAGAWETALCVVALAPPEAGNPRAVILKHWSV